MNSLPEVDRFDDTRESIYDFGNEFLVVCPKCQMMAKVVPHGPHIQPDTTKRCKLVCLHCGLNKVDRKTRLWWIQVGGAPNPMHVTVGGAFDWYFKEPLWLQTECCGNTLWVYNEKHLDFIERYVSASLRTRSPYRNTSLASRLPQWIKSAKNRKNVLRAIDRLKTRLNG